jgi:hypothetical protein
MRPGHVAFRCDLPRARNGLGKVYLPIFQLTQPARAEMVRPVLMPFLAFSRFQKPLRSQDGQSVFGGSIIVAIAAGIEP